MKYLYAIVKYKKYIDIAITLVKELERIAEDKKVTVEEVIELINKLGFVIVK